MLVMSGIVLDVERVVGTSNRDGKSEPYDYHRAIVLDGAESRKCRIGDSHPIPKVGDLITSRVAVSGSARGVSVRLVEPLEVDIPGGVPSSLAALLNGATRAQG